MSGKSGSRLSVAAYANDGHVAYEPGRGGQVWRGCWRGGRAGRGWGVAAYAPDGQWAYEPVRSRTRRRRLPSRSTTQSVAPRADSTRPTPTAGPPPPPAGAPRPPRLACAGG